jgi:hypothetical protein
VKAFISYGSSPDQITALRLQALAAVNGLTVYVPPAYTRQSSNAFLEPESESTKKLTEADLILGVVGAGLSEACTQELNAGLALRKTFIVMSDPVFETQLRPAFGPNLVVIDPAHPELAEYGIVEHLKGVDSAQKKALLALGTLALGLLIFAPTE